MKKTTKIILSLLLIFCSSSWVYCDTVTDHFIRTLEQKNRSIVGPFVDFYSPIPKLKTIDQYYHEIDSKISNKRLKLLNELAYLSVVIRRSGSEKSFVLLQRMRPEVEKQDEYVQGVYKYVFAKLLFNVKKSKLALKYNLESIRLFEKEHQLSDLKKSYINQGFYYSMIDRQKSLYWFGKALKLEKKGILDGQVVLQTNYAFAAVVKKDFKTALKHCDTALLKIKSEKVYDFMNEFRIRILMASIYYRDDLNKSNFNLDKAKEIAIKYEMLESLKEIDYAQSSRFFEKKDYKNAFDRLQEADSLMKVLEFDKISEGIAVYDLEHQVSEEKKDKMRIKKIVEIQSKQKQLLIAFLAFITLALVVISSLFFKIRLKNKVLFQQNLKLANTEVKRTKLEAEPTAEKDISLELIYELEKLIYDKKLYEKPNLTIDKIAKKLNTNRTYLSEAINKHYKENYSTWINEIRINASLKLLSSPEFDHYSIEGIATMVGYSTISSFNATFKKITGLTPSQFKKTR